MKKALIRLGILVISGLSVYSCAPNPYASTNKSYKKQVKAFARSLRQVPVVTPGADSLNMGDIWVGSTNFNVRKPNYIIIHHTAQSSSAQTLQTFTQTRTQVSAHYVIDRNGKVYHMLNDYLRAWHAGAGKWGNNTDINSSSVGIELDNNGAEPFAPDQVASLLKLLAILKKTYNIPTANFIGHADIAPTRKNDPNATFPWQQLAQQGFGLWYDAEVLGNFPLTDTTLANVALHLIDTTFLVADTTLIAADSVLNVTGVPTGFNPIEALRIIGYDTSDLAAAIKAFKLHFIQTEVNSILTDSDKRVLYNLYKKYL
ncbi:N-acetylmuramoyl-L-alanine amidase [Adhaeribacter radiodurans]|uniref:N-acetylmuramoyl-L-alanine amidase n=1 Tax=Adhaeribacter radiodurans TaxID=2745197 RepID=A0A7L7L7P2_9BACT|nr:N-acetylmuramoyl-L-alanine amidase [Adhaeribacter radiodurans]QMU28852.1 N-acetylmuramoyl-L-alanine amidase [Adhaeribacter radiodurans]